MTTNPQPKKGHKSSEFWLSIAAMLLPIITPMLEKSVGSAPADSRLGLWGPVIIAGCYAISRGLAKMNTPIVPDVPESGDKSGDQ